jgi:hypothetical protein
VFKGSNGLENVHHSDHLRFIPKQQRWPSEQSRLALPVGIMMMAKCEEQMEGEGGGGKRFGDFQAEKDVDMSLVTTFARPWRCVISLPC